MSLVDVAEILAAGGVVYAATRRGERKRDIKAGRGGRAGGIPRKSRLVVMYNNTGAKPVEADDAGTAAAELGGRVIGASGRGSARSAKAIKNAARRAGKWSAGQSRTRWEHRRGSRPAETVVDKWKTMRASRVRERAPFRARAKATLRRLAELLGVTDPQVAEPPPRDVPPEPPPPRDPPKPTERARPRPEPQIPPGEPKMTAPASPEVDATSAAAPPDWAALIERVRDFQPENDVDLINFMKGEGTGIVAYAEALESARENCVNDVGLDPSSVAGITAYSEAASEASDRMTAALERFRTVYGQVLELVGEGVVLPHNGRWMTGGTVS